MKFPMFKKETQDKKYQNNPYRVENFKRNEAGELICPHGKRMVFAYRRTVYGNKYGRQEEIYRCEDCTGCPYASECK